MRLFATIVLYLALCASIHVFKPSIFYDDKCQLYSFGVHDDRNRVYSVSIVVLGIATASYFLTTILCM